MKFISKIASRLNSGLFLVLMLIFLSSCELFNTNFQNQSSPLSKMEIHYHLVGGWINISVLDIKPSGEASAKLIGHGNLEILKENTLVLSDPQKRTLARSFSSFSLYKSYYQPEIYSTDGDYHTLILTKEGVSDTVIVYNPHEAPIPRTLKNLLSDIEELHRSVLKNAD